LFNPAPLCVALIVFVVAVITAAALGKAGRMKEAGVMEPTHASRYPERVTVAPTPVKAPPKFHHVIFRLGDDELFRFTHEDAGEDLRYSFEIREGGA
jgi:hypothetical protein